MRTGSVIVVKVTGPTGLKLSYSFGNVVVDLPMIELGGGNYIGEYRVQADERLNGLAVTVNGTDARGQRVVGRAYHPIGQPWRAPAAQLQVTAVTARPDSWLTVGGTADFAVLGTPGCSASVSVEGAFRDLPLQELEPGRYAASWKVPADLNLDNARCVVTARLGRDRQELLTVATDTLAIDTAKPTVVSFCPRPDTNSSAVGRFAVVATDGTGVGVDAARMRLWLDGQLVATGGTAVGAAGILTWQSPTPLAEGNHDVRVDAWDKLGNVYSNAYRFTASGGAAFTPVTVLGAPAILSPANGAQVAEQCVFSGTGRPGTQVRLSISAKSDVAFLDLNRQLPDVLVDVDVTGRWASPPIAMRKPSELFEALFTVSALAVEGERTAGPTVIRVKRP